MPSRPPTHRPANRPPRAPDRRPSASARGYGRAWQALRLSHLAAHPLCVPCGEKGLTVEATEVDHRTPHRGDRSLLMDPDNLTSMCKPCHSAKTVREDGGLGNAPQARGGPVVPTPPAPRPADDRPATANPGGAAVGPGDPGGCRKVGAASP